MEEPCGSDERHDNHAFSDSRTGGRGMVKCDTCRGTQKCQACGGTGIGVLETLHNLSDDTVCGSPKLPSLNPCKECRGSGKCQACSADAPVVAN